MSLLCILFSLFLLFSFSYNKATSSRYREAFFYSGSSYLRSNETLNIGAEAQLGFSFKTCESGELFRQTGDSYDQIRCVINPDGLLVLSATHRHKDSEHVSVPNIFVKDGNWHTVQLSLSSSTLTLDDVVIKLSETNKETLSSLNLNSLSTARSLRVGAGMIACIREGPHLRFTDPNISIVASGVHWIDCPLPYNCGSTNWTSYSSQTSGLTVPVECSSTCLNEGICIPTVANFPSCLCRPGISGTSCSTPMSSCEETPCLHNATCTPHSENGYTCHCPNFTFGPNCENEVDHCHNDPCQNGGTCFQQPTRYLCQCKEFYYGNNCSESLQPSPRLLINSENPCYDSSSPCLNNGTCSYFAANESIQCDCLNGYSGNFCEVDLCNSTICPDHSLCQHNSNSSEKVKCICNPGFVFDSSGICISNLCSSNPCLNAGICTSDSLHYNCSCSPGFEGHNCEVRVKVKDSCESFMCLNGGTCKVENSENFCLCSPGFSGTHCQDDVDECEEAKYNNNKLCFHGTCINTNGSYVCSCEEGWTGVSCHQNSSNCSSNPCYHGGACVSESGKEICICLSGYEGIHCESQVQSCETQSCLNGGNCSLSSELNVFKCDCESHWFGTFCEIPVSPCEPSPCQSNASCIIKEINSQTKTENKVNDYICLCDKGYEGKNCEVNIDDCANHTCPSHQICVDQLGYYDCRCPSGLSGDSCNPQMRNSCTQTASNGSFSCNCSTGWTGPECLDDVNECEESPNLCTHGICANTPGSYECYCRPGFTGFHCSLEFDECLSVPCLHGGNCSNLINSYNCSCAPGFEGINCEINVDECISSPCMNNGTCIDGINDFKCDCQLGFEDHLCQTNIDECQSSPCYNNGTCMDLINDYHCNCDDTGFEGPSCEININECQSTPCQNNATCSDDINDYSCKCFEGYNGKNCEFDVLECEEKPCLNGGLCYEKSNMSLYLVNSLVDLSSDVKRFFNRPFQFASASGFVCSCLSGYEGPHCEININECESDPCLYGECQDGIAEYKCLCSPGYQGRNCEIEINECERLTPCEHGSCLDRIADYSCRCTPGWGGKNCSVALIGCSTVTCLNGGTCTPWLIGETDHKGKCSCTGGFDGLRCQSRTTFSFAGNSYIKVPSTRKEGYELHMKFRTTLGNGLVAIGQGNTHFSLQMRSGKLNLHSNLISKYEGIFIGENLNNTEWQKVYVAVNSSHLTLGVNDRLQATQPINPTGENDTVFYNTYLGGIVQDQEILANQAPEFTGCIQDITVNDFKITEEDIKGGSHGVEERNTSPGCVRVDQCKPNPCQNGGLCKDNWNDYKCNCHRPYLGTSCQYNYTGATFGYENISDSIAVVTIDNPAPYQSGVDISMFIRTRSENGFIFYFGSSLENDKASSYITGELLDGNLVVNVFFDTKKEKFQVYTVNLSDGFRHFIRVVRMNNSMMVKVNETVSINHEIPSPTAFIAERLYLGNFFDENSIPWNPITTLANLNDDTTTFTPLVLFPSLPTTTTTTAAGIAGTLATTSTSTTSTTTTTTDSSISEVLSFSRSKRDLNDNRIEDLLQSPRKNFKGIIQDVQIVDGKSQKRIVELFPLRLSEMDHQFGSIGTVKLHNVKEGIVSDNTCAQNPCDHGALCHVTWNDYLCSCSQGYKGRNCTEKEFCYWYKCPKDSFCNSLSDGHECLSNGTFNGVNSSLTYTSSFSSLSSLTSVILLNFRSKHSGTLLFISDGFRVIQVSLTINSLEILIPERESNKSFSFNQLRLTDGSWHKLSLQFEIGGAVSALLDNESPEQLTIDADLNLRDFVGSASLRVGSDGLYNDSFRGCLGEIRVGGILLPFFTEEQLVNSTASNKFLVESTNNVESSCVVCYETECLNGGFCLSSSEVFECQCPPGFEGSYCQTNIDECILQVCQNGICVDGVSNYTCNCYPGWTGWLCDVDLDECEDNPCLNNGICEQSDLPGNYSCICPSEYEGQRCEELKIKTCAQSPCKNGGSCREGSNPLTKDLYICDCETLYKGTNCEIKKDFCEELQAPCQNNATCISLDSSFSIKCKCTPGYGGEWCEEDINECAITPCYHGGRCINLLNKFECECHGTGYSGTQCQNNVDECISSPCIHGNCSDTDGSYICVCENGFCGNNCQRKNPCHLLPRDSLCKNEGLCLAACDAEPYYTCQCKEEWEGNDCSIKSAQRAGDIAMIAGPVIGGMLFIAIVGILIFLVMARRKRKSEGKYKPANQELTAPRLPLDNIIKPPPEERLI